MCVCCFSPLNLRLFTFNKCFIWTKYGYVYLADKYASPYQTSFYKGLKWCISQRQTLRAVTALRPSVPTEEEYCQLWHLPRAAAHGSLTFTNHITQIKLAGFASSLWSAGNANKIMQFSLFPDSTFFHNLLAVPLGVQLLCHCAQPLKTGEKQRQYFQMCFGGRSF